MAPTERFPIFHNGKWGYIDRTGTVVIKPQFDDAGRFSEGLANIKVGDRCGYIDETGKVVIDLQFDAAADFTEGLAAVNIIHTSLFEAELIFQLDLDKGIIPDGLRQQFEYTGITLPQDASVKIVEPGEAWIITDTSNERTYFVDKDDDELEIYVKGQTLDDSEQTDQATGEWGYIDKTGEIVIEPEFSDVAPFSEGLARIKREQKWGFIDKTGEQVIPPIFNNASDFSEGLAGVETTTLSNAMARPKSLKSYLIYAAYMLSAFRGGFIRGALTTGSKYGFIDKTGELLIEPEFESALNFSDGLACVRARVGLSTKCGYIDRYGNMVIEPKFRWADRFSAGLASVEINGKRGYINKRGEVVVEPKFDDAADFAQGLGLVEIDGKFGYINTSGQFAIEPRFDWAESFSDGLALTVIDGRQGYIDTTGKYV